MGTNPEPTPCHLVKRTRRAGSIGWGKVPLEVHENTNNKYSRRETIKNRVLEMRPGFGMAIHQGDKN